MPEPEETQTSTPSARLQHHETHTLKHLAFGILPFKSKVPAAGGTMFNLNTHCETMFPSQMKRTYIQWDSLFPFICYKLRGSLYCNNATEQVDNIQSLPPVAEEQERYIFLCTITKDITATALQICSIFPLPQNFVMILIPSSYTQCD